MITNITEQQHAHFDALRVRCVVERVFRGFTGSLGVRWWRLYMAACASQFGHGAIGVFQISHGEPT
jgi:cyclopropane fatty-acyl-phospholipid synthase-like methyltransferase